MTEVNNDESMDIRTEFIRASKEKKRLYSEHQKAIAECERLEPIVRGLMEKAQEQKFTRDGITVYLRSSFYVGRFDDDITEEQFCQALTEAGDDWADFVKSAANKKSLASHIKELDEALEDPLEELVYPDCFDGVVKIYTKITAVATKATK